MRVKILSDRSRCSRRSVEGRRIAIPGTEVRFLPAAPEAQGFLEQNASVSQLAEEPRRERG